MYLCQEGNFIIGNYFFPAPTFEAALEILHHVYDGLTPIYGVPYVDNSPWQYGSPNSDPRAVAADPHMYQAAWRDDRVHLNIAVVPARKDKTGADWTVLVVFSRPKQ